MWIYGCDPFIICHTRATFCADVHCGCVDITVLVFHLISIDHLTQRSSNIMDRSPSRLLTILPSSVTIDGSIGDKMVLMCHMISEDHMIKVSYDFMGRSHQIKWSPCQVCWPKALWQWRCFWICHLIWSWWCCQHVSLSFIWVIPVDVPAC